MNDPQATLEQANAAILRNDHEGFLAHCTEDTEWVFEGERRLKGKTAVREWMAQAYREAPRFKVQRMIADEGSVAAIGEIFLKDDKGRMVRHAYCDVWRLHGGRLAELHAFVVPSETVPV